ncbi:MAG: hypothetical protein CL910_06070 [Deltaproteobacteria bacterium]|jgi:hypothetical protein|nr:hypothetical protein [Deltaproteobacteria bacterium]
MKPITHLLAAALACALAGPAAAGTLSAVVTRDTTQANDPIVSTVVAGTQVAIEASKTGTDNCGWQADVFKNNVLYSTFENDPSAGATKGFGGSDPTVARIYFSFGEAAEYGIEIHGIQHNNKPPCAGSALTSLAVTAKPGSTGVLLEKVKDHLGVLKPRPQAQLAEACKNVDCGALIQLPVVEGHFGFSKPGGVLAFKGKGFGKSQGHATLVYHLWTGQTQFAPLQIIEWKPGLIGTKIPANLAGFLDQTASVIVTTAANRVSPGYSFTLLATKDVVEIKEKDVKLVYCAMDSNSDWCNDVHGGDYEVFPGSGQHIVKGDEAVNGKHWNAWGTIGDDKGNDVYEIHLKNGWVIAWTNTVRSSTSGAWVKSPSPAAPNGSSYWKPSYEWLATPNDYLRYTTWVFAEGPRGVPFK